MNQRTIISDIDGTLLKTSIGLTKAIKNSAKEYIKRGNLLGLCTGRSLQATTNIAQELQVNLPCIIFGGALIYDFRKEKILFERTMDPSIGKIISDILIFNDQLSVTVSTYEKTWTIRSNETLLTKGIEFDRNSPIENCIPQKPVLKVLLTCANRDVLFAVKKIIPQDLFYATFASKHFLEIVSNKVNKGIAISILRKLIHFEKQDIWVAGDGLSDLQMKPYSQRFIAPEDALLEVTREADELIPSAKLNGMKCIFDAF